MELPPRARRIRKSHSLRSGLKGTTSACAENTREARSLATGNGNYLRVRGEYPLLCVTLRGRMELPPRARRIPAGKKTLRRWAGTTSACAENTAYAGSILPTTGNYLRVRGEYLPAVQVLVVEGELPPRARRILSKMFLTNVSIGTTSACAENTPIQVAATPTGRNYLRVRGEYKPL